MPHFPKTEHLGMYEIFYMSIFLSRNNSVEPLAEGIQSTATCCNIKIALTGS